MLTWMMGIMRKGNEDMRFIHVFRKLQKWEFKFQIMEFVDAYSRGGQGSSIGWWEFLTMSFNASNTCLYGAYS